MNKTIVKCFDDGNNQYFWCPFCNKNHLHGSLSGDDYLMDNKIIHPKASLCPVFGKDGYYTKNYSKLELLKIKKDINFMLSFYN